MHRAARDIVEFKSSGSKSSASDNVWEPRPRPRGGGGQGTDPSIGDGNGFACWDVPAITVNGGQKEAQGMDPLEAWWIKVSVSLYKSAPTAAALACHRRSQ